MQESGGALDDLQPAQNVSSVLSRTAAEGLEVVASEAITKNALAHTGEALNIYRVQGSGFKVCGVLSGGRCPRCSSSTDNGRLVVWCLWCGGFLLAQYAETMQHHEARDHATADS